MFLFGFSNLHKFFVFLVLCGWVILGCLFKFSSFERKNASVAILVSTIFLGVQIGVVEKLVDSGVLLRGTSHLLRPRLGRRFGTIRYEHGRFLGFSCLHEEQSSRWAARTAPGYALLPWLLAWYRLVHARVVYVTGLLLSITWPTNVVPSVHVTQPD